MRILLVCQQGVSTGMLVENMKKFAEPDDYIEAVPVAHVPKVVENFDVVLVGPQIRYKYDEINDCASKYNKKIAMIDMLAYGMMDGKKVVQQAKSL
ncbi:MAG: PTS sugar transporter subunit IIB [Clostridium sp.]|uniref:PTS sugar transporter subunit IIB n=1 Tax=Clostridium sp. TaxID=1506 RepID=UPI00290FF295|nr:PTS sugar transporter subunit IIB [Clostridium sp.]MDU5111005.1 PTS sugar transporter subunit IIB [Clostridium sp.]